MPARVGPGLPGWQNVRSDVFVAARSTRALMATSPLTWRHRRLHQPPDIGIVHCLVDELIAQQSDVTKRLMAGVEQPQLHLLVRQHIASCAAPAFLQAPQALDEMSSTEENIIPIFNHLFGINAHTLDEIGKELSDDRRKIVFTKASDQNIEIELTNPETQKNFVLHLTILKNQHGSVQTTNTQKSSISNSATASNLFISEPTNPQKLQLTGAMLSLIGSNKDLQNSCPTIATYMHHLLSHDLADDNIRYSIIEALFNSSRVKTNPEIYPVVMSIIKSFPNDDTYFTRRLHCANNHQ